MNANDISLAGKHLRRALFGVFADEAPEPMHPVLLWDARTRAFVPHANLLREDEPPRRDLTDDHAWLTADADYPRRTWFVADPSAPRLRLPETDDGHAPPPGPLCSARLP
jgi:hypothetical protein